MSTLLRARPLSQRRKVDHDVRYRGSRPRVLPAALSGLWTAAADEWRSRAFAYWRFCICNPVEKIPRLVEVWDQLVGHVGSILLSILLCASYSLLLSL